MKKQLIIVLLPLLITSCGKASTKSDDNQVKSGIKGTFVNSVELSPYLLRSAAETDLSRQFPDVNFMYCTIYPIRNTTGWGVFESIYADSPDDVRQRIHSFEYHYDQSLTLTKDMTYHYEYFIGFSPNTKSEVSDFMSIEVDIYGTYTYTKLDDYRYAVSISTPLSGTEIITAGHYDSSNLGWFAGENAYKHSEPDKIVDFAELREVGHEEIDWYVRSRVVTLEIDSEKPSEKRIYDDLFNRYFLDDIGPYCTYN